MVLLQRREVLREWFDYRSIAVTYADKNPSWSIKNGSIMMDFDRLLFLLDLQRIV